MQFDQAFEKIIFRYSLAKPKYLQTIKQTFYTSEEIDNISRLALKFHERFHEVPSKEQMKALLKDPKIKSKISDEMIELIWDVQLQEYDEEWLTSTVEAWIKWRTFDLSLIDTVEYIKSTTVSPENVDAIVNKVKTLINDRNSLTFNSDLGLDFFDPAAHDQKETEKVSSGYNFIDRMLGACRASREQLGSAVTAPLVFFRKRKYDGTRMKLTTTASQVYDDDVICEHTVGAREVFVAKGQFGMMMRRRADGGAADFLHVHGTVPTHICVLDGSSAEVVHAALRRQLDLPCDGSLDLMVPRQVDIACCDAASGNLRNERAFAEAFPRCAGHTRRRRSPSRGSSRSGHSTRTSFDVKCP